jgi:methyl-accepting chemotaxis protein
VTKPTRSKSVNPRRKVSRPETFDPGQEASALIAALGRSQAVISFDLEGTILDANQRFLDALGYSIDEIRGKRHGMFVEASYRSSPAYEQFWERLRAGQFDAAQYKRIGKNGREVWIQASYNPVVDADGKVYKVVKFATDITQQIQQQADQEGQLQAISKAQAVIEFDLQGNILRANENFLKTVGYTIEEVRGKHHGIFVDPGYRQSDAYRSFWQSLREGRFDAGQYKRFGKGGQEIWIQASYNPIFDPEGRPFKVVKYATEITEQRRRQADQQGQLEAIGKAQAVIAFDLRGNILEANENFLKAMGYRAEEVVGRHHSMFVEESHKSSAEYRNFWDRLGAGHYDAGQYLRVGAGGKQIWIQASYNPILDPEGKPFKVVKFATDITAQKRAEVELQEVMTETTAVMDALAAGDLTLDMTEAEDRFSALRGAINASMANLRKMVGEIREGASRIAQGAGEINEGNTNLSSRTQEQAAALEETASTIEEMTATVRQNANNSRQANQVATSARGMAEKGGAVVGQAVLAMAEINQSSKKISDIIGVIDEIAFQTNLLALNAAVEAARAGEQGRGFAVVAAEVRNLAQRSAGAAKEIKTLIKDSVEKVQDGSRLVDQSGSTLSEIVQEVKKVSDIIAEIAAASEEQAAGIEQVNKAVSQMDEMTQQNAALVEQAAAASSSMEDQARQLDRLVAMFKDGTTAQPVERPKPTRSAPKAPAQPKKGATPGVHPAAMTKKPGPQAWEDF